jgi:threonine dehydratase
MAVEITRDDVLEARERIGNAVVHTPLIEAGIGERRLWLKCESLQTGGAFKLRGASNRLLAMSDAERARGVVAFSSGNHAQGVAIAAKRLGMRAVIVMPSDAPALKVEGTRANGAEVIFYDRLTESREAIAAEIAASSGAIVVPSFDDPYIVAGQGTVGLEIAETLGGDPPAIAVPVGGGGLASGIALACPGSRIVGVEPAGWDDMKHSIEGGAIVPVSPDPPPTLCDAIQTLRVAPLTFSILSERKAEIATVTDGEVGAAVRWAFEQHGLTVEPGGAAALAAVLAGKADLPDGSVIILSGGNIDPALHARLVA